MHYFVLFYFMNYDLGVNFSTHQPPLQFTDGQLYTRGSVPEHITTLKLRCFFVFLTISVAYSIKQCVAHITILRWITSLNINHLNFVSIFFVSQLIMRM